MPPRRRRRCRRRPLFAPPLLLIAPPLLLGLLLAPSSSRWWCRRWLHPSSSAFVLVFVVVDAQQQQHHQQQQQQQQQRKRRRRRVAIIGGGISGTFAARYLSEYDADHRRGRTTTKKKDDDDDDDDGDDGIEEEEEEEVVDGTTTRDCLFDEIVVYDVSPPPADFLDHDDNPPPPPGGSSGGGGFSGGMSRSGGTARLSSSSDPRPPDRQGSRVASATLGDDDGRVVELGASVVYDGNRLVVGMMDGDPTFLGRTTSPTTGRTSRAGDDGDGGDDDDEEKDGGETKRRDGPGGGFFGIYHGRGEWLLDLSPFSNYYHPPILGSILRSMYLLYRYSFDLFRMRIAVGGAVRSFDAIYAALDDTNHDVTYFDNPMDVWDAVGLGGLARVSYHDLLDGIGLHRDKSLELSSSSGGEGGGHGGGGVVDDADAAGRWWHWDWRRYMPGMGCLRSELLTGITLNTYNQDLNQMNGFVGLVSYVPAGENVFSVRGGNHRLMESALRQARWTYGNSTCGGPTPRRRVRRRRSIVTTVVASEHSMELFEDDDDDGDDAAAATAAGSKKKRSLGEYDVVILAAPMQMCQVRFLVESPMGQDGAVLHDMPLGGIRENPDYVGDGDGDGAGGDGNGNDEHGRHSFAKSMPPSATIPYTSVVTTVVSNATFNSSHFGLPRDDDYGGGGMSIPRSILVSERGKALGLGGITTLTILDRDRGLIKTFSSQTLESDTMIELFGPDHVVEYVQVWGGKHGGATPSFGGGRNSESLPFLLYDGDRHWGRGGRGGIDADVGSGNGGGPALYYVNAIESAVAAIEISAIGAKATAKLVARRLGLIGPIRDVEDHEEL